MLIDCHTHIGRNNNISSSVTELLKSMDAAGIDKALVFASRLGNASNEYMLEQIAPHTDRLYGVAMVSIDDRYPPSQYDRDKMDLIVDWYGEHKIVAVKFYTGYEHYYPGDVSYLLSRLDRIGCPAIFHSGDCLSSTKRAKLKYAHPLHIDEVAVDYPGMNFIVAHLGFPWVLDTAEVCYKNSNVYTDISGFVYGEFNEDDKWNIDIAISEFCSIAPNEKLLFGTDWPISDQKSYVDTFGTAELEEMSKRTEAVFKLCS